MQGFTLNPYHPPTNRTIIQYHVNMSYGQQAANLRRKRQPAVMVRFQASFCHMIKFLSVGRL